jgi:hypothetical protein
MKKKKPFVIILFILLLVSSCSTTQYFQRVYEDPITCEETLSDTIFYIPPVGIANPWNRQEGVKYKLKWGNLIMGAVFIQTIIIPSFSWGLLLFEADEIMDGYNYKKINIDEVGRN